ncbi:hypothetical protein AGJ45_21255, partial [Cronobacter dublinensis subsp. dublinensis]|nr:hypothetical protein [Cronobacter dublinensis subsp. dublinensis]
QIYAKLTPPSIAYYCQPSHIANPRATLDVQVILPSAAPPLEPHILCLYQLPAVLYIVSVVESFLPRRSLLHVIALD